MPERELPRRIGFFDAAMIMIGMVVGSAIFLSTGIMASAVPSEGLILLAWLVGGLLTLAGALVYAELGAAMPRAGGQYVYIREAYGELAAFLFGWVFFLAYMTGAIASLALAFSEYLSFFVPLFSLTDEWIEVGGVVSLSGGEVAAVAVVALSTYVNVRGVVLGKTVQNLLTILKLATIGIFAFAVVALGETRSIDWSFRPAGLGFFEAVSGFVAALFIVSWAFDGWNNVNFLAGEIRHPEKNVTRTLILGTLAITAIYLVVNVVYFLALPVATMEGEYRIAERAASVSLGRGSAALVSAAVLISVVGALNASILAGARVCYAMARDGLFFASAARLHPEFETPGFALWIQAAWASVLLLSGNLTEVVTYSIFAGIIFWVVGAFSLFALRRKFPELPRPYRVWGYPWVPVLFAAASIGLLVNTMWTQPVESFASLGVIAAGVPAHWYWKRRRTTAVGPDEPAR